MRLYGFDGLKRVEQRIAEAGDIVALAGLEGVEIGTTLSDLGKAERLPGIEVEEPTLSVDFMYNDSPFAGRIRADGGPVLARNQEDGHRERRDRGHDRSPLAGG